MWSVAETWMMICPAFRSTTLYLMLSCIRIDLHSNCRTMLATIHSWLLVTFCNKMRSMSGFWKRSLASSLVTLAAVLWLLLPAQSVTFQQVCSVLQLTHILVFMNLKSVRAAPAWCSWGGKGGPHCHQGGKSPNNGVTCLLVAVTLYNTQGFESHFLDYCVRKQQKQCLLIMTTHAVVYMYSLLCVPTSQYSNKVDFVSMGEAQMGGQRGQYATSCADLLWCSLEAFVIQYLVFTCFVTLFLLMVSEVVWETYHLSNVLFLYFCFVASFSFEYSF